MRPSPDRRKEAATRTRGRVPGPASEHECHPSADSGRGHEARTHRPPPRMRFVKLAYLPAHLLARKKKFAKMSNSVDARKEGGEEEGTKKRVADRRSPDRSVRDEEPHRRVRRGKESADWAEERGMDDVEAALPETLDLSGRAELCTASMHELIVAHPRTSILRLDGCVVLPAPFRQLCTRVWACVARARVRRF